MANATLVSKIKAHKQTRNKLLADCRALTEKAEKENRELSSDEQEKFDKMYTTVESLDKRVGNLEKSMGCDEEDCDEEDREDDEDKDTDEDERADKGKDEITEEEEDGKRSQSRVFIGADGKRYVRQLVDTRNGHPVANGKKPERRRARKEYVQAFLSYMKEGRAALANYSKRDVNTANDITGGAMIAPEQFLNQVLKSADNTLWLRAAGTMFTIENAQSLGIPTLDTDPSDSDWTSELNTGNEDTATSFGKRELNPLPLFKRIKVSNKFLRMATPAGFITNQDDSQNGTGSGAEKFITGRMGYKLAVSQEKALMTGSGVGQPLGVFTASTRGISTGRDIQTGSATNFTFDGLIDAKYNLKQPYHKTAKWLFHRQGVKRIRQLKDSQNRYLWEPSQQAGQPELLLDTPVMMSEYAPSTFTTGSYVGMIADWQYLFMVQSLAVTVLRLNELYAEANQTGFIVGMEFDAMPALEEAFSRLITN